MNIYDDIIFDNSSFQDWDNHELDGLDGTLSHLMRAYDSHVIYKRIFNKYISSNTTSNPNRRNYIALKYINNILDEYALVERKFELFQMLLEDIDDLLFEQWKNIVDANIRILNSLKRCAVRLSKSGIDDSQYKSIIYRVNIYHERMSRILNYIYPEYIRLTPYYEYRDGRDTFDDVIVGCLALNDDLAINDKFFKEFVTSIKTVIQDSDEYESRLQRYKTRK